MVHTVNMWRAGTTALIHGPRHIHAETCPQWTSGTDVDQQPLEWYHTCSHGPVTIRWPICHNFPKVVLADRLQPQTDHQQHAMCGTVVTCNPSCMARRSDVAQGSLHSEPTYVANMSDAASTAETWPISHSTNTCAWTCTCRDVASVDLTDRCRPRGTRGVPNMLVRAADQDGTIRWPIRHNFPKVVFAGTMQRQAASDGPRAMHKAYAYEDNQRQSENNHMVAY